MRTVLAVCVTVSCIMIAALAGTAFADDDDAKGGAASGSNSAAGGKKPKMKFWNLTGAELVEVVMAPAGTDKFGANQTLNDDDKTVATDERVSLADVTAGKYDVRVTDKGGRVCLVKNVDVKDSGPYAFSLEADQLTDCKP